MTRAVLILYFFPLWFSEYDEYWMDHPLIPAGVEAGGQAGSRGNDLSITRLLCRLFYSKWDHILIIDHPAVLQKT